VRSRYQQRSGQQLYHSRDESAEYWERDHELERDRERERYDPHKRVWEHEAAARESGPRDWEAREAAGRQPDSPPYTSRALPVPRGSAGGGEMDAAAYMPPSQRIRDDYRDGSGAVGAGPPPGSSYSRIGRSDTPGSGSGSGIEKADIPSRPDSRGANYTTQAYERAYRLRPVNPSQQMDDRHFIQEDGRSGADTYASSGKRHRNEMEVDSVEGENVGEGGLSGGPAKYPVQDRGAKRLQRGIDSQEDERMES
jgi:hypothetical protein